MRTVRWELLLDGGLCLPIAILPGRGSAIGRRVGVAIATVLIRHVDHQLLVAFFAVTVLQDRHDESIVLQIVLRIGRRPRR